MKRVARWLTSMSADESWHSRRPGDSRFSYTYAQRLERTRYNNLAHGTLAAEALTPATTRLT